VAIAWRSIVERDPDTKTDTRRQRYRFCRIRRRTGRIAVSVTDLRRSNRLRWRRYANFGGTRLWIGCASGHSRGLLVDRIEEPKSQKQVRTFGTTTRELLRLREWLLAEACTHVAMESTGVYWKPIYAILEGAFEIMVAYSSTSRKSGSQDGREGCGMDCRVYFAPASFGLTRYSSQARGKSFCGVQSVAEANRERQYHVGECDHRRFRRFRLANAARSSRR
jgi:hypothetical protein